jgi:hypothetical protein
MQIEAKTGYRAAQLFHKLPMAVSSLFRPIPRDLLWRIGMQYEFCGKTIWEAARNSLRSKNAGTYRILEQQYRVLALALIHLPRA